MRTCQLSVPHGRRLGMLFIFALSFGLIGPNAAKIFSSPAATVNQNANPDGSVERLDALEAKVKELVEINTQQAESIKALADLVNSFYRKDTITCSKIVLTSQTKDKGPTILQAGPHHGFEVVTSNANADKLILVSEQNGNGLRLSFSNPNQKPQESPIMFSSEARTNRHGN